MVPSTLGKYTGVEDKSGTEIYEGDIVYCCDMYGSQAIGTICYSNDFARFYIDLRNGSWLDLQQDDPPEVIGNTHTRIATPRGSFALLNIDLKQAEKIGLGYTFSHGDYHVVSYSDRAFAVRRD